MLIVMDAAATAEEVRRVVGVIETLGLQAHPIPGAQRTAIGITGNKGTVDRGAFENLPGVSEVIPVSAPYKLVSREAKRENTVVSIGGVPVGGQRLAIVAGPCAIESEAQALEIARRVKEGGATLYRGGAYKPRTSPYSFQGLGERGLEILGECRRDTGLPIIVEVVDVSQVEHVAEVADCIRVGTRNAQNFELLKEVGQTHKPVMLKRGLAMTIDEWLQAAEYIAQRGNSEIILCERGIRTFEPSTRNTLDLAGMAVAQLETHLPVIVDPSHAVGKHDLVAPMALAAVAAGADGVMIDVHHDPEAALCDGPQALTPDEMTLLGHELETLAHALGRPMNR